jgi:hypothetical protein
MQAKRIKVEGILLSKGYEEPVLNWRDDLKLADGQVRRCIAHVSYAGVHKKTMRLYVDFNSSLSCFAHFERYRVRGHMAMVTNILSLFPTKSESLQRASWRLRLLR